MNHCSSGASCVPNGPPIVAPGSWVKCSQTDPVLQLTRDSSSSRVPCVANVPPVGCDWVTCHGMMYCEIGPVTLPASGVVVLGRWASCHENELDLELSMDSCSGKDTLPNVCQAGCGRVTCHGTIEISDAVQVAGNWASYHQTRSGCVIGSMWALMRRVRPVRRFRGTLGRARGPSS
jgi:hypothetical protein